MATTDLQIAQLCLPSWWMLHQPECQHLWGFTDFTTRGLFTEAVLLTVTVKGSRPHDGETLLSSSPAPPHYQPIKKTSTCWMGLLSVGESGQCKWSDSMQAIHLQENKRQIIKKAQREACSLLRARLKQKNRHFTVTWLGNSHISKPPKGQKCNDDSMHGLLLLLHCKNSLLL